MNDLKVIGKEHIGQYEFTGIEGGFGKGKRAMTVKDISRIHDTTVKRINELINRNRKRFKDGVDVIDLIGKGNFEVVLNDLGFNQNQINRSAHIYLLSERGYSKLLKILEDDTAWDIYDQLVDNYFNMRQAIQKDSYMIEDPVARAKKWIEEQRELQRLHDENTIMQPKALFADAVATAHTTILVGELAKLIKQNGVEIGPQRLFKWLRANGYLIKRKGSDWNMPTQKSMSMKLFKVKEGSVQNPDGSVRITKTPKVTGKGQQYFINKFLTDFPDGEAM